MRKKKAAALSDLAVAIEGALPNSSARRRICAFLVPIFAYEWFRVQSYNFFLIYARFFDVFCKKYAIIVQKIWKYGKKVVSLQQISRIIMAGKRIAMAAAFEWYKGEYTFPRLWDYIRHELNLAYEAAGK